jgi:hypothetical protein
VKWEDVLFDYKIVAHFRYPAPDAKLPLAPEA